MSRKRNARPANRLAGFLATHPPSPSPPPPPGEAEVVLPPASEDTITADNLPAELRTFATAPTAPLDHTDRYKYLLAYDVRDPRRLARTHKTMKDWGLPVQYSVFELLLTGAEVETMWDQVGAEIDPTVDWVVLYRLTRPFNQAVRNIGVYDPGHLDTDTIIFI